MLLRFYTVLFPLILTACQPQVVPPPAPAPPPEPIPVSTPLPEPRTIQPDTFLLGIDNLLQHYLPLLQGKRIGLLTNPSGVNNHLQPTSDLLYRNRNIHLTAFFAPEHGIRGDHYAGDAVDQAIDSQTGLPVYSLYGKQLKPTRESLDNVDIIVVDIQDIGLRGYTFIYTMAKVMMAAAEYNKKVIVLDRPNPIGGLQVEGNICEPEFFSFVSMYPIPYRHGMTIGELASLFNEEYGIHCQLQVVPMRGWERSMYWDETGLNWVPPSPHIPHWETILYMNTTGPLGELYTLTAGVGYTSPFEVVGAPWIDGIVFAQKLNDLNLPGIFFRVLHFRPFYQTYAGQKCQGVQLHISAREKFSPYRTGLYILQTHLQLYPDQDLFINPDRVTFFNKISGTDKITKMLKKHVPVSEIEHWWQGDLAAFMALRAKHLIY
jgi:uncharacterized protein YbbC (DUF1343 family)